MADHIPNDHPSVSTVRATLASTATGHVIEIPADERDRFPVEEVVRVVLEGTERFARVERPLMGETRTIPGVYDSPRFARNPREGTDRLSAWVADRSIDPGSSVLIDVVEPDYLYGLRAPGETVVYVAKEPPNDSLSAIAEDLEEP